MSVGGFFGCPVVDLVGVPAPELVRPFARAAAVVGQRAELAVYVDRKVDVLPLRIDLQAADPVGACRAEDRAVVAVDLAMDRNISGDLRLLFCVFLIFFQTQSTHFRILVINISFRKHPLPGVIHMKLFINQMEI